jgi:hypothetical protein
MIRQHIEKGFVGILLVGIGNLGCAATPERKVSTLVRAPNKTAKVNSKDPSEIKVAPPQKAEPLESKLEVPAQPLSKFYPIANWAPGTNVRLFRIGKRPILLVGTYVYSLEQGKIHRESGMDRALTNRKGKPIFTTFEGTYPDRMFAAQRTQHNANNQQKSVFAIRKVSPQGATTWATFDSMVDAVYGFVPISNNEILVELGTEAYPEGKTHYQYVSRTKKRSTIKEAVENNEQGMWIRMRSGELVLVDSKRTKSGSQHGLMLTTWKTPTSTPTQRFTVHESSLFSGRYRLVEGADGSLFFDQASWYSGLGDAPSIEHLEGTIWKTLELDNSTEKLRKTRLDLAKRFQQGATSFLTTVEGRSMELGATSLAEDQQGGLWALAGEGSMLVYSQPSKNIVHLGKAIRTSVNKKAPKEQPPTKTEKNLPKSNAPSPAITTKTQSQKITWHTIVDLDEQSSTFPDEEMMIFPTEGRTFITIDKQILYIDGDALKSIPAMQKGVLDRPRAALEKKIQAFSQIGSLGGHFPNSVWLSTSDISNRVPDHNIYHWTETGWSLVAQTHNNGITQRFLPLTDPWVLMASNSRYSGGSESFLSLIHPTSGQPIPGGGLVGMNGQNLGFENYTLSPDRSLFAVSNGKVLGWDPQGKRLSIPTPTTEVHPTGMVASANNNLYLLAYFGKTLSSSQIPSAVKHLAHYDGTSWRSIPLPTSNVDKLLKGPDHSIWVSESNGGRTWEFTAPATWKPRKVPGSIAEVWQAQSGDVWALSDGGRQLWHSHPAPAGFQLSQALPEGLMERYGYGCPVFTIVLQDVPKSTAVDYPFTKQLKEVKTGLGKWGAQFLVMDATWGSKRYLLAQLSKNDVNYEPTVEQRVKDFVKKLRRKAPGKGTKLVCVEEPKRRMKVRTLNNPVVQKTP